MDCLDHTQPAARPRPTWPQPRLGFRRRHHRRHTTGQRSGRCQAPQPTRILSPLPLLVPRIRTDHEDDATAPDDLALITHATNAGADLHGRTREQRPGRPETEGGTETEPQTIRRRVVGHKGVVRFPQRHGFSAERPPPPAGSVRQFRLPPPRRWPAGRSAPRAPIR